MKRFLKNIVLFLSIVTISGCENWLELIPPEGLIRDEFWTTKEDVGAVVMGAYESFAVLDGKLFKYGEIRADMVIGDYNQSLDERDIQEGNIYADNYLNNWHEFYQVIDYCNEVIKNAPKVKEKDNTFTDYQLQGYLSEAYFLRSLSYFYLVRIFKDVPFVTEPTESDDAQLYVPKSAGEEILEAILEDLEEYQNFATIEGYRTIAENKGRATKGAYYALIADIALWMFDYEKVLEYTGKILALDIYELMPEAQWFGLYYPGNSLESIFEFQFNTDMNQRNNTYGLTQRYGYNYDPSQKALEFFAREYATEQGAEKARGEDASIKKYGEDDYIIWKYVGMAPDGETTRIGSEQASCNWIVYRLADVILMQAEALSQLGRFNEAKITLNIIREERNVPILNPANTPTAFEDAIMEERARELAFEGKRWFDLMRMGRRNNYARKAKIIDIIVQNVPSTQKRILKVKLTNPLGWYLPIHEEEIERNRALIQNPYYNF
jgi:hypothetical protein